MNKEYLLILPNIFIGKPLNIGNITLQRFGSDNEMVTDVNSKEVLLNVQQMLINNGFSGVFTYSYLAANNKFEKIVLNVRKIMALFRYIVFEKHPDLSLERLTYYLLKPVKIGEEIPEMKYSLGGIQNGNRPIPPFAPGFQEVIRRTNYPEILYLDDEHFLIQKFNAGELKDKDKYIIAIERFNRTFKENQDPVEDILNLTTAFEHIFELKGNHKADLLAKNLIREFGLLDGTSLKENFSKWSKEFYVVRDQVSHGNAFRCYDEKKGYTYWEEYFNWKHPDGAVRYVSHTFIAKKIFKLVIERLLKGEKINKSVGEKSSAEMKEWLEQIEYQLVESEIEPLITPNEIYYRRLKKLVDSDIPFGLPYYDLISKIKQCDRTEERSVLFELSMYFLSITENKFPDLKEECDEMKKLIEEETNTALMGVKAINLSQKIDKKKADNKIIDDERVYDFYLSQFFEKVFYSLTHIALFEKIKN
jgi:hypothetical protein